MEKSRKSRKEKEVKKLQVTLHNRSKQLTEHLFFAIINAEKGIVTRCVENGRSQRKKRSFYGKNISDRKLFLPYLVKEFILQIAACISHFAPPVSKNAPLSPCPVPPRSRIPLHRTNVCVPPCGTM